MGHEPSPDQRLDPPEAIRAGKRSIRLLIFVCISVSVLAACSSSDGSRGVSDAQDHRAAPRFDTPTLIAALKNAGFEPHRRGPRWFDTTFATHARNYCVDRLRMTVYEYQDRAERQLISATISNDGDTIGNSSVRWSGPPHFYARGRLIVQVLGNAPKLNNRLTEILGPTLSPDSGPGRGIRCSPPHDP